MRPVVKGSTDQSVIIRIVDSTDGTPEQSVEHDTAGVSLWYRREGAAVTAITPASLASASATHADGGLEHLDDGYYRLDLPDAAVATGVNGVMVGGAFTGMVVIGCYVPLFDVNPYDAVRMGMTALPNAAADAAGGLPISDAGGLDLDAQDTAIAAIEASNILIKAATDEIGVAGAGLTNINLPNQTMDIVGNITGNLSGSVGSVTGAVGSVTGAVGSVTAIVTANVTQISGDSVAADNAEAFFDGTGYAGTNNVIPTVTTVGTLTTYTGNTPQTGDAYARLGAPAGASVSADVAAVKAETASILTDTGTTLDGKIDAILTDTAVIGALGAGLTAIIGADGDTLKTISDQIDGLTTSAGPQVLADTTIATLSTQTSFTLTAGSADNDAYNGAVAIITDQSTATQKAVATILDYVGSTKTVTLAADPAIFTMAVGDSIAILANISSAPTAAAVRAEIDANSTQLAAIVEDTAEIGVAGAGLTNINLPNQTMDITGNITGNLSGSVGSVTGAVGSVTGNVGGNVTGSVGSVAAGGITAASIATDAIDADALAADAIAEINATVDTALSDIRLDELLSADSDIDGAAPPTVGSVFHELMTKTAGSFTYDQATDSLEAVRDRGDAAWLTATGFSTHSAADVWAVGTRSLTVLDEDSTTLDLDATIRAAVGLASADLDVQLDAIVADTGELQADLVNGGRLDLLIDAIKAKTDLIPASPAAVGDIPSAATIVAAIFAELMETGYTFKQATRLIAAACAGKLSGAQTATETFRSLDDSANRITATVDSSGNRSAVTHNA